MMYRQARAEIVNTNPDLDSIYKSNRTASRQLMQRDPNMKYYIVTGIHGDTPNNNGDYFRYAEELLKIRPSILMAQSSDPAQHKLPVYTYQTWNNRGSYINHNSIPEDWNNPNRVGTIIDTYPIHDDKRVDFLVAVDKRKAPWLVRAIDEGAVTDVSMGCWVDWSLCGRCGHLATAEENWCDCLRYYKGRDMDGDGTKVYEDNRDITGMEISWIVGGSGADSDAKYRMTLAGEDEMAFSKVQRSNGVGGGVASSGVNNDDVANAKRIANLGLNGKSMIDPNSAPSSIILPPGVEQKLAMLDKLLAQHPELIDGPSTVVAEERDLMSEIEEIDNTVPTISRPNVEDIRQQIASTRSMRAKFAISHGEDSRAVKSFDNQISILEAELSGTSSHIEPEMSMEEKIDMIVKAELAKLGTSVGRAGGVAGTDEEAIRAIVNERLAAMGVKAQSDIPSASLHNTAAPVGNKSDDAASMISGEKPGKSHSVEIPNDDTDTDADLTKTTIPSASMENPMKNTKVNTDPASMINGENPGKSYSIDIPTVQAMLNTAVQAGVEAGMRAAGAAIPSAAVTDSGKLPSYSVEGKDPDGLIKPEKAGAAHSVTIPEVADGSDASGSKIPSGAMESGKLPKYPAEGKDPESFIDAEKKGKPHSEGIPTVTARNIKASFVANDQYSKSHWMITSGIKPIMKITASNAFPIDTKGNYEWFSSDEYAGMVTEAIKERGIQAIAREIGAQLLGDEPKGAGGMPEGNHKPLNPSPDASDKMSDEDGAGKIPLDELISGIFAVLVAEDGHYTVDEIKSWLQGISGDGMDGFMENLQDSIDELKGGDGDKPGSGKPKIKSEKPDEGEDADEDEGKAHEDKETPKEEASEHKDKKPPFGGKQAPPFGGKKPPFGKKEDDDDDVSKKKVPTFLQDRKAEVGSVGAPKSEDEAAYYRQIFPADFVNGLFNGDQKSVKQALDMLSEAKVEKSKGMQAKRVSKVLSAMEEKGMLDDGTSMMSTGVPEITARRKAQENKKRLASDLLAMDDQSFETFVRTVSDAPNRTASQTIPAPKNGMRAVAQVKQDTMGTSIADADEMAGGGEMQLWSTPIEIDESRPSTRSASRNSRQAQSNDITDVELDTMLVDDDFENVTEDNDDNSETLDIGLQLSSPSDELLEASGIDLSDE